MTDREKLIEILSVPIYPHLDTDPAEVVADYLLDNGVTFATDINVGSTWISVEDKMPEPYVSVLTLRRQLDGDKCSQMVDHIIPAYDGNFVWFIETYSWKNKVTHWMPLPEPPENNE